MRGLVDGVAVMVLEVLDLVQTCNGEGGKAHEICRGEISIGRFVLEQKNKILANAAVFSAQRLYFAITVLKKVAFCVGEKCVLVNDKHSSPYNG